MNKITLMIAIVLLDIATCFTVNATDVYINESNFPDATFRAYVSKTFSHCNSNYFTPSEISNITSIKCDAMSISNLKGIEYFTALTNLNCANNNITAFDVSKNSKLTELFCSGNNLISLEVGKNKALKTLSCFNNSISKLDVSNNKALTELTVSSNQLTSLDVSNNTLLTKLDCSGNKLKTLDVSKNTALTSFECYSNKIGTLDVSNNTLLTKLNCSANKLKTLDVSKNTALTQFECYGIQLSSLDVSKNTALVVLNCVGCNLSSLDVTNNTVLANLYCDNNNFTALDVTNNTALVMLYCNGNSLSALNLSNNKLLSLLYCCGNKLAALDLSNNADLSLFKGYENSRTIKVYSYTRSKANGGETGYYVPLKAQDAVIIKNTTYGPTKALATLIDDAGQEGDPAFDTTKVVLNTWGGATLGSYKGTQVLLLNQDAKAITYQYDTGFTGSASTWYPYQNDVNTVVAPNAYFTLKWDLDDDHVVTGVDGVESNDVSVYTTAGTINVGGSFEGAVDVYNLAGQQVYCGNDSEIAVPAGMYIVKVNGKAQKVLVK